MASKKFIKKLGNWLYDNRITHESLERESVDIEGFGRCFLFDNGDRPLFDTDMYFTDLETDELEAEGFSHVLFQWGDNFYHSPTSSEKVKFNVLRNVGTVDMEYDNKGLYCNLGVHGRLEMLNGSSDYGDWCKKAKFLEMEAIGVAEKNTLAATMPLQLAAEKAGIGYVFGISVDVLIGGTKQPVKVYAQTQQGWQNLLRIAKAVNVDNHQEKLIPLRELVRRGKGNVLVLGTGFPIRPLLERIFKHHFKRVFYQFDTTQYDADRIDAHYLECLQTYLNGWGTDHQIDPILISDSYYIEPQEADIKKLLNKIATGATHRNSSDQFFKTFDDHYETLEPLFEEGKRFNGMDFDELIDLAAYNTVRVAKGAEAKIELDISHLPEYEMTSYEKMMFDTREDLFLSLIEDGFRRKVSASNIEKYKERFDYEFSVISRGGFVDYFLILWDIIRFCKENGIMTGIGRGSAAGSLISYLLDITEADPIEYGLLFERFLNEGRVVKKIKEEVYRVDIGNKILDLQADRYITVKRGGKRKRIQAKNLIVGDEIINK